MNPAVIHAPFSNSTTDPSVHRMGGTSYANDPNYLGTEIKVVKGGKNLAIGLVDKAIDNAPAVHAIVQGAGTFDSCYSIDMDVDPEHDIVGMVHHRKDDDPRLEEMDFRPHVRRTVQIGEVDYRDCRYTLNGSNRDMTGVHNRETTIDEFFRRHPELK